MRRIIVVELRFWIERVGVREGERGIKALGFRSEESSL